MLLRVPAEVRERLLVHIEQLAGHLAQAGHVSASGARSPGSARRCVVLPPRELLEQDLRRVADLRRWWSGYLVPARAGSRTVYRGTAQVLAQSAETPVAAAEDRWRGRRPGSAAPARRRIVHVGVAEGAGSGTPESGAEASSTVAARGAREGPGPGGSGPGSRGGGRRVCHSRTNRTPLGPGDSVLAALEPRSASGRRRAAAAGDALRRAPSNDEFQAADLLQAARRSRTSAGRPRPSTPTSRGQRSSRGPRRSLVSFIGRAGGSTS